MSVAYVGSWSLSERTDWLRAVVDGEDIPRVIAPKARPEHPMRKALQIAASLCWAIEPQWLETILEIAAGDGPGPEAVAKELGRPLNNQHPAVENRDGVAVVKVHGPIFRHANMMTDLSGATSLGMLARDFQAALADDTIAAIVLDIDSPGGEARGVHEFASHVLEARSVKPVVAYVGGNGASAAYWIASAASVIFADATAQIGSIGVVSAYPDPKADAKTIEIVSSQSPKKRVDVSTKEGRATVQARVDALADIFVANVARNRGVDTEHVLENFGRGDVMLAEVAKAAGMIDGLSSLEETIAYARRLGTVIGERAMGESNTIAAAESSREPAYEVGDRVRATAGHMKGMKGRAGEVAEAHADAPPYYAVLFDGDSDPHKWLNEDEIEPEDASAAKPKKKPMKMSAAAREKTIMSHDQSNDHAAERDELLTAIGESTVIRAVGVVESLKIKAGKADDLAKQVADLQAKLDEGERTSLLASLRNDNKLTAHMERLASKMTLDQLRDFAKDAEPIPQLAAPKVEEPKAESVVSKVDVAGKKLSELTSEEAVALRKNDPDLFKQMLAAEYGDAA